MGDHQGCQSRVVGSFSSHLAAVDKFEPTIQNIRGLGEERELIS